MTDTHDTRGIRGVIRNPLVVFGLILIAGDGPLVAAYALAREPSQSYVLMWATIIFIFGMGSFFCYLVAARPRHLYAPRDFPDSAFGRNIYREPAPAKRILEQAQDLVDTLASSESNEQRKSITEGIKTRIEDVKEIQAAYELLHSRGYDIAFIYDILNCIGAGDRSSVYDLTKSRNFTPSTADSIIGSMIDRDIARQEGGITYLTENGQRLRDSLRHHMTTPHGSS